jgi:diacylglycerol kinase family enzyme
MVMFDQKLLKQEYTISIDGQDMSGDYASVNIANGPCYGGDKSAVITAVPDDGLLDILLLKGVSTMQGLRLVIPYTNGHYESFPRQVTLKRGKTIAIRSQEPLVINLDGEILLDTNITVDIVPKAVKIVAPNHISYKRRAIFHEPQVP